MARLGGRVDVLDSVGSTNEAALAAARDGVPDGYVVFAEHQTAGRGRLGRTWCSPRGASVMVTVLLVEGRGRPVPEAHQLGLIAAIATTEAIAEATGVTALIDWPNDVVIGDRKVAGILVESRSVEGRGRAFAIGIGINCLQHQRHFPAELQSRATSLDLESSVAVNRGVVAGALLERLDGWLADSLKWRPADVRAAFLNHSSPLGRRIRLRFEGQVFEGQVVDLDPSSDLVVQLDTGGRRLFPAATTSVLDGD